MFMWRKGKAMGQMIAAFCMGIPVLVGLHAFYCLRKEEQKTPAVYMEKLKDYKQILMLLAAALGMASAFFWAAHYGLVSINRIRNELVFAWLYFLAFIDAKEQIIPKQLTVCGYIGWGVFVAVAVFLGKTPILNVLSFSLSGFLMGGGVFFLCRLLSKGGVGMGDIRMFAILGLLYGLNYTFSIVFFTILFMSIYGIVQMIRKKKDIKSYVPMAPFACAAYTVCILLGV